MSKIILFLLVATFAACINADDNGDGFGKFLPSLPNLGDAMKPLDGLANMGENFIKNMPQIPNGFSSGSFKSEEHHTETKNGEVVSDGGSSHSVTNDNGNVTETSSSTK